MLWIGTGWIIAFMAHMFFSSDNATQLEAHHKTMNIKLFLPNTNQSVPLRMRPCRPFPAAAWLWNQFRTQFFFYGLDLRELKIFHGEAPKCKSPADLQSFARRANQTGHKLSIQLALAKLQVIIPDFWGNIA